mmetsp:Transcript_68426/g.192999  ORF Transcript_68426/g.192999 Transcript_68426/m.192999 type:complete len:516 (+) Transcript_68426:79-1626(+)
MQRPGDLERQHESAPPPRPSRFRARLLPAAIGAVLLAAVLAVALSQGRRRPPSPLAPGTRGQDSLVSLAGDGAGKKSSTREGAADEDTSDTEDEAAPAEDPAHSAYEEWEVVYKKAMKVRDEKNFSGRVIGTRDAGSVVVGRREGKFLALLDGAGYLRISMPHMVFLEKRFVSYKHFRGGSCADTGWNSILDADVCAAAGSALGFSETFEVSGKSLALEEGCYKRDKATPESGNRSDNRTPIILCSNETYPVTDSDVVVMKEDLSDMASEETEETTTTLTTNTIKTTTSTSTFVELPYPSLYCWLVTRSTGYEPALLRDQFANQMNIFSCDAHAVFSDKRFTLGPGHTSIPLGTIKTKTGHWGSWVNGKVFVRAWQSVIANGAFERYDWVAKVDPDTVMYPNRLKLHLKHTNRGELSYFKNTLGGYPIIGALEVLSRRAVERYRDKGQEVCEKLTLGSAEDWYIYACMEKLGVEARVDYALLQHNQSKLGCHDGWIAAFHPFKSIASYHECIALR